MMKYSIVVLTSLNRLPALQRCIAKIRAGAKTTPEDREIIVVNNGSTDGTRAWLDAQPDIHAIHRETNEFVCARNYGISVAGGDYIIQVDDDVLVAPGFDDALLRPYSDEEVGATGPHGFYQDSTWGLLIDDRRRPRPGQFCDLVMGYCWSWRKMPPPGHPYCTPRWEYDTAFNPFWHEESDLQLQIRAAGYRIMMTPPVASHHTLHDWGETKRDGPLTGLSIAKRNFHKLVDKWQEKNVRFEGPAVGLVGLAPGKAI